MMIPRWVSIEWFIEFNEVLKHLVKHGVKTVLDVGCGACTSCKLLEVLGIECVGLDIDCSRARCKCVEHDIRKPLPFPDKSFDAVISMHTIEHVEEVCQLFAVMEMVRVARKVVVVLTPNRDFGFAERDTNVTEGGEHKHVLSMEEAQDLCRYFPMCVAYDMDPFFYASVSYRGDLKALYDAVYGLLPKGTIVIVIERGSS